jgi:hypothetical protein
MNWFRFYHEALDDPKVQRLPGDTYKAWVNLLCLASRSGKRGYLPSVEDIGFALRISTDAAQALVDDLSGRGLIDDTPDGLMPHNWPERQKRSDTSAERVARYRERNAASNDANNSGNDTGNVTDGDEKRDGNALEKNREEKSREEQTREETPKPPKGDDGDKKPSLVQQFDAFWDAYPRKVGKQAAFKSWSKINPGVALTDTILTAIANQKDGRDWTREDGRYIPNPATWLNQGRWDDVVLPPTITPFRGRQSAAEVVDEFERMMAARDHDAAADDQIIEAHGVAR